MKLSKILLAITFAYLLAFTTAVETAGEEDFLGDALGLLE